MDVNEDQLVSYRASVIEACKAGRPPQALGVFLKRNPNEHGDVSRVVYDDYAKHVKDSMNAMLQPDLLHVFMKSYEKSPHKQLVRGKPDTKAETHLNLLLNKPGVAIAFSNAFFKSKKDVASMEAEKFKRAQEVILAGESMTEEGAIRQAEALPVQTLTAQQTPLDVPVNKNSTRPFNKQARLKLRNFIKAFKVDTVRNAIRRKPGWTGYVHMNWDPRMLPKTCARDTLENMHEIFRKVFYGSAEHRVKGIDDVKDKLEVLTPWELTQLDWYLSWIEAQSDFEVKKSIITVKNSDILPNNILLQKIDQQYVPDSAGAVASEFQESSAIKPSQAPIAHEEVAKRLGQIRGVLLDQIKSKTVEPCPESEPILVPAHFDMEVYPDPKDQEHVVHIHRLAGGSGWGPAILTSAERKVYEDTINRPLVTEPSAGLVALAAFSAAVHANPGVHDKEQLIAAGEKILDAADTPAKVAELVHSAHVMHLPETGKVLLDMNGPYWTVRNLMDGSDNQPAKTSPGKMTQIVRGVIRLLDSDSKKENMQKLFGVSNPTDKICELAGAAMRQIADSKLVAHPLSREEVASMCEKAGVHLGVVLDDGESDIAGWPISELLPEVEPIKPKYGRRELVNYDSSDDEGPETDDEAEETTASESENNENDETVYDFVDVSGEKYKKPDAQALAALEQAKEAIKPAAAAKPAVAEPTVLERKVDVLAKIMTRGDALASQKMNERRQNMNRIVVADTSKYKDAIVFLPRNVKTAGNKWVEKDHVMRATQENLWRVRTDKKVTMMSGKTYNLADIIDSSSSNDVNFKLLNYQKGPAVVINIPVAISEVPYNP